ncbi:MAG TPA: hypothetical protein PLI09_13150 [Candidatus Hydrogenedentes bacterium]|nr:hypothetical protein [Candidatus Hydrogenedentota bacterium]
MKLAILKLISLLVFLGGIVLLGLNFHCSYIEQYVNLASSFIGTCPVCNTVGFYGIAGTVLLLAGLYGFLPSMKRKRRVTYPGPNGETTVELAPMETMLTRIVGNMPEVKRIRVCIKPAKDKKKVVIVCHVIQQHRPDTCAREVQNLITRYIKETAVTTLGLDIIGEIQLTVDGIDANPKAVSKALREQFTAPALVRMESEEIEIPVIPQSSLPGREVSGDRGETVPEIQRLQPLDTEIAAAKPDISADIPASKEAVEPGESSRSDFDLMDAGEQSPFDSLGEPLVKKDEEDENNGKKNQEPLT